MLVQKDTTTTLHYAHRAEAHLSLTEGPITYGELAKAIGCTYPLNGKRFGHVLMCVYLSSPQQAARVVRAEERTPGGGFYWCQEHLTGVVDSFTPEPPAGAAVMEPFYPLIEVQLSGNDGNAFGILGAVQREMKRGGLEKARIDEFMAEATSGDYDALLRTCMKWVTVL